MREIAFESKSRLTQAEFAEWVALRAPEDFHVELINGRIVMNPPAGWPHSEIGHNLGLLVGIWVKAHRLGRVFDSSQGFELPSGDTVEPDRSFVSEKRWARTAPHQVGKFLQLVPDLVIETLSSNSQFDRGAKKKIYEANGVRELWLVDYLRREVTVFSLRGARFGSGKVHRGGTSFKSRAVSGLTVKVSDIFPDDA